MLETNSSMKNERANKEQFNTNIIPRILNALTHLIFFLLTSQFIFLQVLHFLCMVNSNNIADLHNQNFVVDMIIESIKQVIKPKARNGRFLP